jgi:hypothetical protein
VQSIVQKYGVLSYYSRISRHMVDPLFFQQELVELTEVLRLIGFVPREHKVQGARFEQLEVIKLSVSGH